MDVYIEPLTGSEIHQLSLHGIVFRNERCWCCGSKRYVTIVNGIICEYCKLSDEKKNDYIYKCPYYIILNNEKNEGVCITPYTDMGNCKGRDESVISIIQVNKIVDILNLIDEYGIEEVSEFIKNDNVVKELIEKQKKL